MKQYYEKQKLRLSPAKVYFCRFRMLKKICISIILFAVSASLAASKIDNAFAALKIYDYFKAKKLFYSSLKKEPVLASYGLATIYYRHDNPFHNYDSAYKFIEITSSSALPSSTKQSLKFKKYGLSVSGLMQLRDSIHYESFSYYLNRKDKAPVAILEEFINNQPHSLYINKAFFKRDSIEYNLARSWQESVAITLFIQKFPESSFLSQAYRDLDYFRFNEFSAANSIPQIQKFIDSFPQSRYRIQAEDKLFEIAAAQKNTSEMYRLIKKYPGNSHVELTWKSLYSIEVGTYSSQSLTSFLNKYKDFPYRETIEKELALAGTRLLMVSVNDKFGFIDTTGSFIIPAVYEGLEEFSDGLALAEKEGLSGYINKAGTVSVLFMYDDGEPFKNGRAIVKKGKDFFLIDRTGTLITGNYDQISDFNEGLAVVKYNGKYGAIDKNGKTEIPLQYTRLGDFSEGYSFAQKNERFGYVDKKGDPVIPFLYEWAESFKYSLARVKYNSKFGLINKRGEFVLQPVYDRIEPQEKGVYIVYKNNQYGFADSTGCLLSDVIYINPENEKNSDLTDGRWLRLITEDDQNLMNKNGKKLAADEEYEEMYLPQNGLIRVSLNDKYGYINSKGKLSIKNVFDEAEDFADSVATVKKRNEWQIINLSGTALFSVKTNELERLNDKWFSWTDVTGNKVVSDRNGTIVYSAAPADIEIVAKHFLRIEETNGTAIYDLLQKKYVFRP